DLEASVELLGELPTMEAVKAEYRRADVFCLPSLQEGFGIVFLEAMAAGLPIVALRTAAIPEVVPDGETGLLVNPDRPEALREALIRLLRDHGLRAAMGGRHGVGEGLRVARGGVPLSVRRRLQRLTGRAHFLSGPGSP
ncbi:MAG: glycosyltransferase family 4 protein, partial [Gemmatimonadota bacterium]